MSATQDYVALEWIRGELANTLQNAQVALEAVTESAEDATSMRTCLTAIHQVHSTLKMVQLQGPAQMAAEMEQVALSLVNNSILETRLAQETLMQAILQLPAYLGRLHREQEDSERNYLPMVNNLRAVRGKERIQGSGAELEEGDGPDLGPLTNGASDEVVNAFLQGDGAGNLPKIRMRYRQCLGAILKKTKVRRNLTTISKLFIMLIRLCGNSPTGNLAELGLGIVEGVASGGIKLDNQTATRLKQIDDHLKPLAVAGQSGLSTPVDEELALGLIRLINESQKETKRISTLRQRYESVAPEPEEVAMGPDDETMSAVASILIEELNAITDKLDLFVCAENRNTDDLSALVPNLEQISSTMVILGNTEQQTTVASQISIIKDLETGAEPSEDVLLNMAQALLEIGVGLGELVMGSEEGGGENSFANLNEAHAAVIKETRIGLAAGKDSVIDFISSEFDHANIEELPQSLKALRGGLMVVNQLRAGDVLEAAANYVTNALLSGNQTPELEQMNDLADAITSVDYYLERLLENGGDPYLQMLEVAETAVEKLGNTVVEESIEDPIEDASKELVEDATENAKENATENATENAIEALAAATDESVPVGHRSAPEDTPKEVPQDKSAASANQEMVRVSADLLAELIGLADEASVTRGRVEQQMTDFGEYLQEMEETINRVRDQARRFEIEAGSIETLIRSKEGADGDSGFDDLKTDRHTMLQAISRTLSEGSSNMVYLNDMLGNSIRDAETLLHQQARISAALQEGLARTRRVPFVRLIPRLRRIVKQISGEAGKSVRFDAYNVEGELDRNVFERIVAPLEHILRNAIGHGIEDKEVRAVSGKHEQGRISLRLSREGRYVVLTLSDDGGGIDVNAVRDKAIERGLITKGQDVSDHEVMQLIMHAGFSTAQKLPQTSGRGVGMYVVSSEIKALGGSIVIDSTPGVGSEFTLRIPFTVSLNRALMIVVKEETYAVPLNTIEGIVRVSPDELKAYYQPDAPMFEYAGQPYKLAYIGKMLNKAEAPDLAGQVAPLPVILARSGDHAVALQVDKVIGSREVVVKTLGPRFSAVGGISGATVLGDGSVVIILDCMALIRSDEASANVATVPVVEEPVPESDNRVRTVMIVDDSVTLRKVTTRLMQRHGFKVATAKDGIDAISQLQNIRPDVVLLDIEMPRMDGFEVLRSVRRDENLKDLPVIMMTSRTDEKHKQQANELGVSQYLDKPFQEADLLAIIEEVIEEVTEEVTEEVAEEVIEEVTEEVTEEVIEEVIESAPAKPEQD